MKKKLWIILTVVQSCIMWYGCTTEEFEQQMSNHGNGKANECVFVIPNFQPDDVINSRTSFTLNENGATLSWLKGDTIGILPDIGAQVYFVIDEMNPDKSNEATFDGGAWGLKSNNNYAAYYPFIGDIYLNRTQIPVDYTGQIQKGKVEVNEAVNHLSAYDYMAALAVTQSEGNLNFQFSHLGALVEVKFNVPTAGPVKQFCLRASDKVIPVKGTFDLTKNPVAIVPVDEDKTDQLIIGIEDLNTTVDNEEVSVIFMLPPMETKTNALTASVIYGEKNQSYSLKIKTEKTLEAGKCYSLETEVTTEAYPQSLLLPDNVQSFSSNIANALTQLGGNKLKFVAKSSMTSDIVVHTDKNGVKAYAVKNGDWLEIHTYAEEFKAGQKLSYMFNSDKLFPKFKLLREIDLSALDTEDVTEMYYMFGGCSLLTSINLSGFNTSSVNNMGGLFMGCSSLESITFGDKFNTSSVTNMRSVFAECSSLTSLDLSSFNTSNVIDMDGLLMGCSSLESITFGDKFDTSSVTNMGYVFAECSSLTSLDLSSFNTSNVIDVESMFNKCSSLESITFGDKFDTSSVTNMGFMFYECSSLTSLDLSSFNTSNVMNMKWMFAECELLSTLDISSFNTSLVTNMELMFGSCESITSLDLSSFSFKKKPDCSSMFSSTGFKSTNKPIDIYVTADGKVYLEEESTNINSNYAKLVVKTE